MNCNTSDANKGADALVTPIVSGIALVCEYKTTPLIVTVKVTDPEPDIVIWGSVDVSPWSAERVCPEVTGKLPVAFVNVIGPDTSKKSDICALVVVLFVKITLYTAGDTVGVGVTAGVSDGVGVTAAVPVGVEVTEGVSVGV